MKQRSYSISFPLFLPSAWLLFLSHGGFHGKERIVGCKVIQKKKKIRMQRENRIVVLSNLKRKKEKKKEKFIR